VALSAAEVERIGMANKDMNGRVTETTREATQAERSPNTFWILIVSLIALVLIGAALFWYFGVIGTSNTPG
jgi:hypothetical protein